MITLTNNSSSNVPCREASLVSTGCLRHLALFLVVSLVAIIGGAAAVWGQCPCTLSYTFDGEAVGDWFGYTVSGAGDVDNDGYDDLIIGAPYSDSAGSDAGRAYVYSGQTGGLLYTFNGEAADDKFGWSVSGAGDINEDGYDDLIVGAYWNGAGGSQAGRAYVFSGLDGDTLYIFTGEAAYDRFGWSVSGAGDVNNDDYPDLIVGAYTSDAGGSAAGRAYAFSGLDGDTLYIFTGEGAIDLFGHSVSGAGDVNNDGYDDLIVGAPENDGGGTKAGRAYVFSGIDGDTLYIFTGEAELDLLGASVSGAGDVNNDGYDDLIVGAPESDSGGTNAGRAYVYSGQTGGLLWTFTGQAGDQLGRYRTVSGVGDVDNDGHDDMIVGAMYNNAGGSDAGEAYVYSGQTGALLCTFTGEASYNYLGHSVSGAGDVNNDGHPDLIFGAPGRSAAGPGVGRAYVFYCQQEEPYLCGDVNGDDVINSADVVYLINYLFKGGPAPAPECTGDVNCDDVINSADVVYLINYLFKGGPEPGPDCCSS